MNARVSGGHRAIPQASPGHRLRAPDAGKTKPHEAWVLHSFIRGAQSSDETSTGDPHGSGFPWPHHKGSRINTNTSVPTEEPHDLTVPQHLPRVFPVSPRGTFTCAPRPVYSRSPPRPPGHAATSLLAPLLLLVPSATCGFLALRGSTSLLHRCTAGRLGVVSQSRNEGGPCVHWNHLGPG